MSQQVRGVVALGKGKPVTAFLIHKTPGSL